MSTTQPQPKGCAATPFQKKKVAVFGGGGYLGSTVFGFLQRASSLYGTGLGAPRYICATAMGSDRLNKNLSRSFQLAFAGEDSIGLTNIQDIQSIGAKLKNVDAVILGTVYQVEQRPITLNTYEKNPNEKTYEFYLDEWSIANHEKVDDDEFHLQLFRNSLKGCQSAGVKHVVVIQTPSTKNVESFVKILEDEKVYFTLITSGKFETTKGYTFEQGLQAHQEVQSWTSGGWMDVLENKDSSMTTAREDIAAIAVQSLMTLDWETKRVLKVKTGDELKKQEISRRNAVRFDRIWCNHSELLAEKLAVLE